MANLKGSDFTQQARSAYFILDAFGVSRHANPDSQKTHSIEMEKKRKMYLKDFSKHALSLDLSGKLNVHMGDYEVIKGFLLNRITNLSKKTSNDYVSGISSMFTALSQENITIADEGFEAIEDVRALVKEMPKEEFRTGRYIANAKLILNKLCDLRFESGVLAQVQYETGFRIAEAYKLAKNPEKYLFGDAFIVGMVGKGNHKYDIKSISDDLVLKLSAIENLPTAHTYSGHLKLVRFDNEAIPHDWRVTYVKEQFDKRIRQGMCREEALKEVSKLINHYRTTMTEFYLLRA